MKVCMLTFTTVISNETIDTVTAITVHQIFTGSAIFATDPKAIINICKKTTKLLVFYIGVGVLSCKHILESRIERQIHILFHRSASDADIHIRVKLN